MQPSEEIKSKLDLVDIVAEYVKLTQAGSNFRANCPFHQEKSPSFMVSQDKQIWRCFGCAKGGDLFTFVMEIESLSFKEALSLLAPKAGVTLKKVDPKLSSQRNRVAEILDISSRYYQKVLLNSSIAKNALAYLRDRGLTEEMIEEWGIGCSPDSWDDLYKLVKKKGFTDQDILDSGMIIKKDKGFGYYNRFRGRIMFPIKDMNGNVVAFTARVSPEKEKTEKMGKYINSPQTLAYNKSNIIFGLDKAKLSIKNEDLIIVVEGQMDVITAHTRGFKNVIASSGTALTSEQVVILKRYSSNIALAFDMDVAGKLACDRAIDEAYRNDMDVSIIEVPFGKDPDDCIKNSPDDWVNAVKSKIPAMEFYFKEYLVDLNLDLIQDKRVAVRKLLPKIIKINNDIEEDYWLRKLSNVLDVKEELLREALKKIKVKDSKSDDKGVSDVKLVQESNDISRSDKLSRQAIGILLKFPYLIELAINKLSSDYISDSSLQGLYNSILIYYNSNINIDISSNVFYNSLRNFIEQKNTLGELGLVDQIAMEAEKIYQSYSNAESKEEFLNIIIFLKEQFKNSQMKKIEKLILEAEQQQDNVKIAELMDKFKTLSSD